MCLLLALGHTQRIACTKAAATRTNDKAGTKREPMSARPSSPPFFLLREMVSWAGGASAVAPWDRDAAGGSDRRSHPPWRPRRPAAPDAEVRSGRGENAEAACADGSGGGDEGPSRPWSSSSRRERRNAEGERRRTLEEEDEEEERRRRAAAAARGRRI